MSKKNNTQTKNIKAPKKNSKSASKKNDSVSKIYVENNNELG